ncbi:MAG: hypothetical protein WCK67_06570 [bacterium]
MYTVEQLREQVKKDADKDAVSVYLKNWKIDPVYEDEDNVEYFDEFAILKLNQGIKLKEEGKTNEEIVSIIHNGIVSAQNMPALRNNNIQSTETNGANPLNKLTFDITTQTLALLAESIAHKISTDITNKVKESDLFSPVADAAKLERDNEILSKQVEKLLTENKKLISRVNFLQEENAKFKHVFGNFYSKAN